ncbi:hypothetical protein Athai_17310 [Actinocatenispora thailandica]|uniref:Uncharacterized protein n=1 Tax=Actinocatenispora thailandica TaxID=227318 RepID=A0A7R7DMA0_9ACTN|nr:hypothetical protein [Actinocatenispora thailandica]BCJ34228.1 hypothetical protein Athai_17310 [Actinocatenispora thailandica]
MTQHSAIADFAALGGTLEIAVGAQPADPRVAVLTAETKHAVLMLHPDAASRDAEALIGAATFRLLWFRAVGPDRDGWQRVGARRRWRLTIRVPRA